MREKKTPELVLAAVLNMGALIVVNTALVWREWTRGVVLESWADILWAANLSIGLQIVGNVILALYRPPWFSALMRLAFSATGLISAIVFFVVFPLDFSHLVGAWLNTLIRVLVIIGIGGSAIATLVELVRLGAALGRMPWRTPLPRS